MFGTKCYWADKCDDGCEECDFVSMADFDEENDYLKSVKEDIDFYYRTQVSC